jgi:hypothetical protein
MAGSEKISSMGSSLLSRDEIETFAADWYRKLDEHVSVEQLIPMLAELEVEFLLPETSFRGVDAFREWYEGVIRLFFDEAHTLQRVDVSGQGDRVLVDVVVNWQARRWNPPAPHSQWIGFDAYQQWEMTRSPLTGYPVIQRYVVNDLRPMPGSSPL